MAFTHITFNVATPGGSRIHQLNLSLENGLNALTQELATISTLCDGGDPNNVANYTAVAAYYGYATNVDAKSSHDELASLASVLTGTPTSAIASSSNKHR